MLSQETEDYWIWNENTLVFKPEFNKPLDNYIDIIGKYNNLIFSNYNDFKIYKETNNIYKIEFDNYYLKSKFNQEVINLPLNLTYLTFGWYFNQEVNNLPQNLTYLTFGFNFNQEVNNLPQNLTHLTFDSCFNQEVNNLPQNITHLTFGYDFNQPVNKLPPNITHLTFGDDFNQPLDNVFYYLTSLTHLTLGLNFNQKVDLPFNITSINLNCNNSYYTNYLPESIVEIKLGEDFNLELLNLPSSIKKITFNKESKYNKELNCLPNGLEILELPSAYDIQIQNIPSRLKKLICSKDYIFIKDFVGIEVETY